MSYGGFPYGGVAYAGSTASAGTDTKPSLSVEVAFTTDPLATPVWEVITDDVQSWETMRGRNRELERFQPGRATVVLGNRDAQYDSLNVSGPHYGYLKPMRRIRIRETFNGVTYPIFDGFIDKWQLSYPGKNKDAVAVVTATDAMKVWARTDMPPSVYYDEVQADAPVAWWRLGDPAYVDNASDVIGTRELAFVDNPRAGETIVAFERNGSTFFDHPDEGNGNVVRADSTMPFTAFPFTLEMVFRSQRQADALYRILLNFAGNTTGSPTRWVEVALRDTVLGNPGQLHLVMTDDAGATGSITVSAPRVDDGSIHHVAIVVDSATFATIYIDGVDATSFDSTKAISLPSGTVNLALGNKPANYPPAGEFGLDGELADVAVYDYALSSARIAVHADAMSHPWQGDLPSERIDRALDEAEWPSTLRELDAGLTTFQSADIANQTVLEHIQKSGESEYAGLLFVTRDGKARFVDRTHVFAREVGTAVYGDSAGEVGYSDFTPDDGDEVIRNRAKISRLNGAVRTQEDATSIADFSPFEYVLEGLLHDSEQGSTDYAFFVVDQYKDQQRRITQLDFVTPITGDEDIHYPAVLGPELGDAITVRNNPLGGDAFEQVCVVEGIRHRSEPGVIHETTFTLSPELPIRTLEDEDVSTLGYAQVTADQGSVTTEVDLTGLTTTVTVGSSRRIKITGSVFVHNTAADTSTRLRIKESTTVLQIRDVNHATAGVPTELTAEVVLTPSAGSHTYKLSLAEEAGAGTTTMAAGATFPAFILVEDIGPA